MKHTAPILVGHWKDKVVWIRVDGKGNFQNSPQIKEYALRMIDEGERRIVIDLENCPVMDSTFMGTLTGISRRLSSVEGGKLEVLNANERNCQLICSLGLDYIFDLDTDGEAWPEERKAVSENIGCDALNGHELDKRDQTEFILDAHENLTEASEDNLPRFRDVIDCLKKELDDSGSR